MIDVVTFGCRLNALESEVVRARASAAGLGDALVVSTCAVTGEAVRQARQVVRRAGADVPGRPIVVTGCAAQIAPETFAAMPEVALVLGNEEKLEAAGYRLVASDAAPKTPTPATGARVLVGDIMAPRPARGHRIAGMAGRSRAFLQVQNGCDHRCTFCIIPFGRGNSRSVPAGEVVAEVRAMVEAGHAEIVLTGVDITAYGLDLDEGMRLGTLVRKILGEVRDLRRLRLSSIDSIEVDPDLLAALAEDERLMPHLHLSLQSGDDLILKRMKRRHSRADAIRFAGTVRRIRPDVALGADIIAGFPTETEEAFRNSLALVEECGITHLHVFPFSPRPDTPAARMPQLDGRAIRERAARLRAAGQSQLSARLAGEVGRVRNILVERGGTGHTEHFLPVTIDNPHHGSVVAAHITGVVEGRLAAETLRAAA